MPFPNRLIFRQRLLATAAISAHSNAGIQAHLRRLIPSEHKTAMTLSSYLPRRQNLLEHRSALIPQHCLARLK